MSHFGDDAPEMPRNQPFDDEAIEAIFTGTTREAHLADLTAFVSDVRVSAETAHSPSPALAAALAAGFSTDKGARPATAASNVHGPARQVSGLPKWRKLKMKIQGLLAGLGVAGKVALGASLAAAATTGAGAAGILPGPVQHIVATTVGSVTPFHMPDDGASSAGSPLEGALPEPTSTTTQPARDDHDGARDLDDARPSRPPPFPARTPATAGRRRCRRAARRRYRRLRRERRPWGNGGGDTGGGDKGNDGARRHADDRAPR